MNWLNRLPNYLMHVVFVLLMLLSVILYKERLFADAAYYFFHSINSGWFHIEADRITIALSQIFPLAGYWLGLPLQYLMVLSSLGHELYFYILFLLLLYKLKDKSAALCLLLVHLIGQLWLYYMPFLEISYGAALAIVFYALLKSNQWKDDKWLILLLLIEWFVLFSHPENLFLIPTLIVFDYLNRGLIKQIHLPTIAVFFIGVSVKVLNFSAYDRQKLGSSINSADESIAINQYINEVLTVFADYYPEVIIFLIITIGFLIFKKEWKKLAFTHTSLLVLIFIINKIEDTNTFYWYAEVVNTPIVFLVLFFFVFQVVDQLKSKTKQFVTLLLIVVACIRIGWIWQYGEPIRHRAAQLERVVDYAQMLGYSKYLIESDNYHKSYTMANWANPIEALLFSAIDGKEKTVSLINDDDLAYQQNKSKLKKSNFLFRKFNIEPHSFLNPNLFELKQKKYHLLNNPGFSIPYKEMANEITIVPFYPEALKLLEANDSAYVLINITNRSGLALPSGLSENIFLSYHWLKDGKEYQWDGLRTPLEVDVYNEYTQDILVKTPTESGLYELQFDIVLEGKDWFGLQEKVEVYIH